jgi:hypothetical protein
MGVTDPSGTFIIHICPLFPMISTCLSVPFGLHWIIVTTSVGVCTVLCVLAFVSLWIAQMITGLVLCVNHCARVLFTQGTPRSFVLGFYLVFCYVFVWSSPLCLYTARRNLGLIKPLLSIPESPESLTMGYN